MRQSSPYRRRSSLAWSGDTFCVSTTCFTSESSPFSGRERDFFGRTAASAIPCRLGMDSPFRSGLITERGEGFTAQGCVRGLSKRPSSAIGRTPLGTDQWNGSRARRQTRATGAFSDRGNGDGIGNRIGADKHFRREAWEFVLQSRLDPGDLRRFIEHRMSHCQK